MPRKRPATITPEAIARYIALVDPAATPLGAKLALVAMLRREQAGRRPRLVLERVGAEAHEHWYIHSGGPKPTRFYVRVDEGCSQAITVLDRAQWLERVHGATP